MAIQPIHKEFLPLLHRNFRLNLVAPRPSTSPPSYWPRLWQCWPYCRGLALSSPGRCHSFPNSSIPGQGCGRTFLKKKLKWDTLLVLCRGVPLQCIGRKREDSQAVSCIMYHVSCIMCHVSCIISHFMSCVAEHSENSRSREFS